MDTVDRQNFTKRKYVDALAQAERELGSVLPYGEWSHTYSDAFKRIRGEVIESFRCPENYLAAPDTTLLPVGLADIFNETIVPLTKGEIINQDVPLPWHGPPVVAVRTDKPSGSSRKVDGAYYPRL